MKYRASILWWGRSDPEYARNKILRQCLVEAGYRIIDFRPRVAAGGAFEATFRIREPVNFVWVPCFRQRDLLAARRWSARRGIPLIFDPLISAYDKQVFERAKFSPDSRRSKRLLAWERHLFGCVDLLLADTRAHAELFQKIHRVQQERVSVVPLSADERLFTPRRPKCATDRPLQVLFYGSFIPLQGPEVIVEAANCYQGAPVRWSMVGDGPLRASCHRKARPGASIEFEDWIPYLSLPDRIAEADVVLGIFGDTPKAARVVPNKLCQAMACARPVVTRESPVFPAELDKTALGGITRVPPADPEALAQTVAGLADSPQSLAERGADALSIYRRHFSAQRVAAALETALDTLTSKRPARW